MTGINPFPFNPFKNTFLTMTLLNCLAAGRELKRIRDACTICPKT